MFKLLKERMGHDDSYSNSYQDYFMEREQIILYSHVGRDETKKRGNFGQKNLKNKQPHPAPAV